MSLYMSSFLISNKAKAISTELLELNLKKKLEETGKNWKKQDYTQKLKKKKHGKLKETGIY